MPSRKRNKGQARKASDKALLRERQFVINAGGKDVCLHGCPPKPSSSHPCVSFMRMFGDLCYNECDDETEEAGAVQKIICSTADAVISFPEVVKDDAMRDYVVSCILSQGAHRLLTAKNDEDISYAAGHAGAIMLIERCVDDANRSAMINVERTSDGSSKISVCKNQRYSLKMRNVMDECPRSVARFYSKRLQCSCADEMHEHLRKTCPKIGICDGCQAGKKRRHLMVCGSCRARQYCSDSCQLLHWAIHRTQCKPCLSEPLNESR